MSRARVTTSALILSLAGACTKIDEESGTRVFGTNRPLLTTAGVRTIQRSEIQSIDPATLRITPASVSCAEPSPDIAIALGEGRSGGVTASGLQTLLTPPVTVAGGAAPTPADINLALSLSSSHAEAVAQLGERLATIQLLRDGLHRACEAYANGAITPTIYTLMVSRLDELLVTLLATEIAGGAFGRQFSSAAAGATADAQASQAANATDEARNKLDAFNNSSHKVADEQNKLGVLEGKLAATPAESTEQRKQLQAEIDTQRTAVSKAQQEQETARTAALDALSKLGVTQVTAARSSATALAQGGGQIGTSRTVTTTDQIAEEIGKIQVAYMNDTNADALIVACIAELATTPAIDPRKQSKLGEVCAGQNFEKNIKAFIHSEIALKRELTRYQAVASICGPLQPAEYAMCVARFQNSWAIADATAATFGATLPR